MINIRKSITFIKMKFSVDNYIGLGFPKLSLGSVLHANCWCNCILFGLRFFGVAPGTHPKSGTRAPWQGYFPHPVSHSLFPAKWLCPRHGQTLRPRSRRRGDKKTQLSRPFHRDKTYLLCCLTRDCTSPTRHAGQGRYYCNNIPKPYPGAMLSLRTGQNNIMQPWSLEGT